MATVAPVCTYFATIFVAQVSVCPGGVPTGYTYFIPQEELLESRVMTRGYMESRMVVLLAGRCASLLGSQTAFQRTASVIAAGPSFP